MDKAHAKDWRKVRAQKVHVHEKVISHGQPGKANQRHATPLRGTGLTRPCAC